MNVKMAMQSGDVALLIGCAVVLILMARKHSIRAYGTLFGLVCVRGLMTLVTIALLFHRKDLGLSLDFAYKTYFYFYWASATVSLMLEVATIYTVYRVAMRPLEGLKRIGTVIFRWVAIVSGVLSSVVVLGPHVRGASYLATLLGQVQEGVCVLTICLLLFVCLAIRPLGLTYRSRLFGISLGLGIASCVSLITSTWLPTQAARSLYSPIYLVGMFGTFASMMVWATYFALPEPARRMILLPTTSPYFLWNRISEALGDEPGVVAVAGFTPAMLAPAEMAAIGAMNHSLRQPELVEEMMPQRLALSR
jgi:hypothetical protein